MDLIEYQKLTERKHGSNRAPCLPCVTELMAVFNVQLVIDQPLTGASGVVRQGQAARTVHQVLNHTLLGYAPPATQAGRHVGPAF